MNIEGKGFIVTGGASGLGAATARMLASHGGKVVIADVQVEAGEAHRRGARRSASCSCDVSQRGRRPGGRRRGDGRRQAERTRQLRRHRARDEDRGPRRRASARRVHADDHGQPGRLVQHDPARGRGDGEERPRATTGERGVHRSTRRRSPRTTARSGRPRMRRRRAASSGMTLPIARDLSRNGIRVHDDRARHLRDADDAQHAAGRAGRARRDGAVPAAARQAGRIRDARHSRSSTNAMLNGEMIRLDGAIRMAADRTSSRRRPGPP